MSQEALAEAEQNESHCRRVADELSLVHRYCDPDRSARQMLGIRQENEVRLEGFSRDLSEDEIQENILRS
jgi:hypothetical protein